MYVCMYYIGLVAVVYAAVTDGRLESKQGKTKWKSGSSGVGRGVGFEFSFSCQQGMEDRQN